MAPSFVRSVVREMAGYTPQGLENDADAVVSLANAEHLDGHAASVTVRRQKPGC